MSVQKTYNHYDKSEAVCRESDDSYNLFVPALGQHHDMETQNVLQMSRACQHASVLRSHLAQLHSVRGKLQGRAVWGPPCSRGVLEDVGAHAPPLLLVCHRNIQSQQSPDRFVVRVYHIHTSAVASCSHHNLIHWRLCQPGQYHKKHFEKRERMVQTPQNKGDLCISYKCKGLWVKAIGVLGCQPTYEWQQSGQTTCLVFQNNQLGP